MVSVCRFVGGEFERAPVARCGEFSLLTYTRFFTGVMRASGTFSSCSFSAIEIHPDMIQSIRIVPFAYRGQTVLYFFELFNGQQSRNMQKSDPILPDTESCLDQVQL